MLSVTDYRKLTTCEESGGAAEQVSDRLVRLEGMAQLGRPIDRVRVAATHFGDGDDAGLFEVGEDAVDSSLGDSHPVGDFAKSSIGIERQTHEHVGVIAEERPRSFARHVRESNSLSALTKWQS